VSILSVFAAEGGEWCVLKPKNPHNCCLESILAWQTGQMLMDYCMRTAGCVLPACLLVHFNGTMTRA
jgi:hypothetical protein